MSKGFQCKDVCGDSAAYTMKSGKGDATCEASEKGVCVTECCDQASLPEEETNNAEQDVLTTQQQQETSTAPKNVLDNQQEETSTVPKHILDTQQENKPVPKNVLDTQQQQKKQTLHNDKMP